MKFSRFIAKPCTFLSFQHNRLSNKLTSLAVCRCVQSKASCTDTVSLHCDREANFCTLLPSYTSPLKTVNMLPTDHTTFWNDADNCKKHNRMGIPIHLYGKLTTENCKWSRLVPDHSTVKYWRKTIQLSSDNAQLHHFIRLMVAKKPPSYCLITLNQNFTTYSVMINE